MVEHNLAKVGVEGSNPFARSKSLRREADSRPKTTKITLTSRSEPPDTIIELVEARSAGKRFARIEDVLKPDELVAISNKYEKIAGDDLESTRARSLSQT